MIPSQAPGNPYLEWGRLAAVRCEEAHMIEDQLAAQRRIVAGVDGSKPSRAALAWAVRQAKLTGR